jgi:hypothetical protein
MSQDLDATYTYTFETHGDYGLQVEFVRGPNRLATAEFPLVVEALSRDNPAPLGALQLALAFGLGAVTIEVARGLGLGGKLLGGSRTRA